MNTILEQRTPIDAMDSTIAEFMCGGRGRDVSTEFKTRYASDRFKFSSNESYLEDGYLKVVVLHPESNRTLIATFDAEIGPAWRPRDIIKNTLVPAKYEREFVCVFADTLMTPVKFESEEDREEMVAHWAKCIRLRWIPSD